MSPAEATRLAERIEYWVSNDSPKNALLWIVKSLRAYAAGQDQPAESALERGEPQVETSGISAAHDSADHQRAEAARTQVGDDGRDTTQVAPAQATAAQSSAHHESQRGMTMSSDGLRVTGNESAASQEGSAPASTPVATDGYQPVAPASAAPLPDAVQREIDKHCHIFDCNHARGDFEYIARLAMREAVPEGCVVVPAEATEAMIAAGACAVPAIRRTYADHYRIVYRAMLAAAKEKP